jgi:predicted AAA+ superfamily ATPase
MRTTFWVTIMKYKKRFIEEAVLEAQQVFKIILLVGPRQCGKSTLLCNIFPKLPVFVFDQYFDEHNVRSDPDNFLRNFPGPLILDEVQYVPELLSALKRKVDTSDTYGQYFLTGSQNLAMLKSVAESMAGRVCVIEMTGLTLYEAAEKPATSSWLSRYLQEPRSLLTSTTGVLSEYNLLSTLWRGNLPQALLGKPSSIERYKTSYAQTYIDRDVRTLGNSKDLSDFGSFMRLTSALSAQEINYHQLGREIALEGRKAKEWLQVMQYTYTWRAAEAYSGNTAKRLSQKPKGYFFDTGIMCSLQRLSSPEALSGHPLFGAIFETWVSNMIHQLNCMLATPAYQYHWRANNETEVDIILDRDGWLYPIEVKAASSINLFDVRGMKAFRAAYPHQRIAPGLVIYNGTQCYQIDENTIALPWNALCE